METIYQTLAMLKELEGTMLDMANEAKKLGEMAVQIRKRSEETEKLVSECLKLLEE